MWQNHCISEFAKWLRDGGKHEAVNVLGLDLYSKEESLVELLRFLDVYNPDMAKRVRFACPEEWPSILSKLQWTSTSIASGGEAVCAPSKLEQFGAEQNLECMISAEEYYHSQGISICPPRFCNPHPHLIQIRPLM